MSITTEPTPKPDGHIRVVAAQLAAGFDVETNLKTVLRVLDDAADVNPDLVVLPEFCNHLSWYDDADHCDAVSVDLDGDWLGAVRDKAAEHRCYVVVNVTLRHTGGRPSGSSILISPDGDICATSNKQVLMGHENDFLAPATTETPIADTTIGRIGLYACMDGVIFETPRSLALRGAQILCNSLNSFALDEASLHVPVRAPENRVFIVAANKIGPLVPEAAIDAIADATGIPRQFLYGAGESQIVAPDGTVLAKADRDTESYVWADIDPTLAENKRRPDGVDVFALRQPEQYGPIASAPTGRTHPAGADELRAAVVQTVDAIAGTDADLIVLPELTGDAESIAAAVRPGALVVASIIDDGTHTGIVVGTNGIVARQPAGTAPVIVDTPWGRLGVIVGTDSLVPEAFRLLALADADVVAVPFAVSEAWEVQTGLLERAAENRLCLVAATRPNAAGTSLICDLERELTLMTPWTERTFDGNISRPIVHRGDEISTVIHPSTATSRNVSSNTDLVDGRPWQLADALTHTGDAS